MEITEYKPTRFFFSDPNLSEPDRNRLTGMGKWWLSRLKIMQEAGADTQVWEKTYNDGTVIRIDTSGDIDNVKIETIHKEKKKEEKKKKERMPKTFTVYEVVYLGISEAHVNTFAYPASPPSLSAGGMITLQYIEGHDRTPRYHPNFLYGRDGWESTEIEAIWEVDPIGLLAPPWPPPYTLLAAPSGKYGIGKDGGIDVIAICSEGYINLKEVPDKVSFFVPSLSYEEKKEGDDGTYQWVYFSDKQVPQRVTYGGFLASVIWNYGGFYIKHVRTYSFNAGPITLPTYSLSYCYREHNIVPGWKYFAHTWCNSNIVFWIPDIWWPNEEGVVTFYPGGTWEAFWTSTNSPAWYLVDEFSLTLVNGDKPEYFVWAEENTFYDPNIIFKLYGAMISEDNKDAIAIYSTAARTTFPEDTVWTDYITINDYTEEIVKYDETTGTGGYVSDITCLKFYGELNVFLYCYRIWDEVAWDNDDSITRLVYGIVPIDMNGEVIADRIIKREFICPSDGTHTVDNCVDIEGVPYHFFGEIDILKRTVIIDS